MEDKLIKIRNEIASLKYAMFLITLILGVYTLTAHLKISIWH